MRFDPGLRLDSHAAGARGFRFQKMGVSEN